MTNEDQELVWSADVMLEIRVPPSMSGMPQDEVESIVRASIAELVDTLIATCFSAPAPESSLLDA